MVVEERGPEHRKTFMVEVRVGRDFSAQAEGPTKKMAEQEAARLALAHYRDRDQQAAEQAALQAAEEAAAQPAEQGAPQAAEEPLPPAPTESTPEPEKPADG